MNVTSQIGILNNGGSNTPVAKNLGAMIFPVNQSQYDNSSNRGDLESDLSASESDFQRDMLSFGGGEISAGVASINKDIKERDRELGGVDNLSEVSEESAFEEEDEDYFGVGGGGVGADQNKNNFKDGGPLAQSNGEKSGKNEAGQDEDNKGNVGEANTKKKKTSIRILASMPRNAKEEEEKFFTSNFTINP